MAANAACLALDRATAPAFGVRPVVFWHMARALLFLVTFAWTAPAFAHASLIGSDPADNSVVPASPSVLVLTFNEPVTPIALRILDDRGITTDVTAATRAVGDALIVAPAALTAGTHSLSWRVISADGHPVAGTVVFSISRVTAGAATGAAAVNDVALAAAIWVTRLLLYVGLFGGVGGAFFAVWIGGPAHLTVGLQRLLLSLIASGLVAAVAALGVQGADVLGTPLLGIFNGAVWAAGAATAYGSTVFVAIAALLLAAIALVNRAPRPQHGATLVALLSAGVAFSLSGHAADAPPQSLTWFAVFTHTVTVAFWVGSLIPLGFVLISPQGGAAPVLLRFSRAIPYAIVPLILTGLVLALLQLAELSDLWTTAYGLVLSAKLAAVVVLLAIALVNRVWLTPQAVSGQRAGRVRLAQSIAVEVAVVVAALGVVALWRFAAPPRALVAAAGLRPVYAHVMQSNAMAEITITPGRAGPIAASIVVTDGKGRPLDPKGVTMALSNPSAGVEAINRTAVKAADGTWRVTGLILPIGGIWQADLGIVVSDFEEVELSGPLLLPP